MSPQDALEYAVLNGDHKSVRKAIADGADPKDKKSWALRLAAMGMDADSVRLLIPLSDPKALDSEALQWAAIREDADCVKLLFPVSDVEAVRIQLRNDDLGCALALLDAIVERDELKAKHLKLNDERARAAL